MQEIDQRDKEITHSQNEHVGIWINAFGVPDKNEHTECNCDRGKLGNSVEQKEIVKSHINPKNSKRDDCNQPCRA